MCDSAILIEALQQQTEAINAFAVAVAQLTDAVAVLIDFIDIPTEEQAETMTYMDGTRV